MTKKSNDSPALAPHEFTPKESRSDICAGCGGLRITPAHGYDMAAEATPALAEPAAPLEQPQDTVAITHLIGSIVREIYGDTAELGHYKLAIAVYRMNESEVLRLRGERLMLLGELGKAKISAEKARAAAPSKGMELAEKVKVTRTAWLEQYGVPISHEFAEFTEALGNLCKFVAGAAPSSVPAQDERVRELRFGIERIIEKTKYDEFGTFESVRNRIIQLCHEVLAEDLNGG